MSHGTQLRALVERYVEERSARTEIGPRSAASIRYTLLGFLRITGSTNPRDLSRGDVERWMAEPAAISTKRCRLSRLRTFCHWLVREGVIDVDPTWLVKAPRPPRYIPRALRPEDVALLLASCPDERAELIVLLMVQEGLRCCEVSSLEIGDVDPRARTLRVVGKGGHERVLPFSDETFGALARYMGEAPPAAGPVIRSYNNPHAGIEASYVSTLVRTWLKEAGVKRRSWDRRSAHALRHTAATDMLRAGAHLRDVQRALGHARINTTELYLPLEVSDLRLAMGGRRYRVPTALAAAG